MKRLVLSAIFSLVGIMVFGQDNSPYSRYGLGDLVPNTSIVNRGMGSISAGYSDPLSVNFNNPASYAAYKAYMEGKAKKATSGRVLFDVGLNFDTRTLKENNPPQKFASSNAIFSYMQLGMPIRNNWGLNFGLRQISRVGYKQVRHERLYDPVTGNMIDSAVTEFNGDGGLYLASIGTGFSIKNLSIGVNFGYLFGKKETDTRRAFVNDTVEYKASNHSTKTSYGNIFANAGIQYRINMNNNVLLTLGAFGNLKQELRAEQNIIRETFVRTDNGDLTVDSVYTQSGIKGKVTYPAGYGAGFVLEKKIDIQNSKYGTWLLGVDFIQNNWDNYRFFGAIDSVKNNWQIRVGGQVRPEPNARNYFSNVAYRAGFFVGNDYIHVGAKMPVAGISFGLGLPIANYNRLSLGQASIINLSFEYMKRGNNDNLLKENLFRISVGLSFSDLWFVKRKYE